MIHDISDHFPSMMIIRDIWADRRELKKIVTRDINDCKLSNLKNALVAQNWSKCYSSSDPTEQYSNFMGELTSMLDEHIPIREITVPVKKPLCEPWMTKGL